MPLQLDAFKYGHLIDNNNKQEGPQGKTPNLSTMLYDVKQCGRYHLVCPFQCLEDNNHRISSYLGLNTIIVTLNLPYAFHCARVDILDLILREQQWISVLASNGYLKFALIKMIELQSSHSNHQTRLPFIQKEVLAMNCCVKINNIHSLN